MYKYIESKKHRLSIETFKKSIRTITKAYNKGFGKFKTDESYSYFFTIYNIRILFSIKRRQLTCHN